MTDARDRAIEALCDTTADLRERIAQLEIAATIPLPTMQPTTASPSEPPAEAFTFGGLPVRVEPGIRSGQELYQEWIDNGGRERAGKVMNERHGRPMTWPPTAYPPGHPIAGMAYAYNPATGRAEPVPMPTGGDD